MRDNNTRVFATLTDDVGHKLRGNCDLRRGGGSSAPAFKSVGARGGVRVVEHYAGNGHISGASRGVV